MKLFAILLMLLLCACEKVVEADGQEQQGMLTVPSEFEVMQRTSAELPGSNGKLEVRLGDITRGRVKATIKPSKAPKIASESLRQGQQLEFQYEGHDYVLLLIRLDNQLIGVDSAKFLLQSKESLTGMGQSVSGEVEALLLKLSEEEGAVMIRNGKEYSTQSGTVHLRRKYYKVRDRIESAEDFINEHASKSSATGQDYLIRLKDGTQLTSREWFSEQLKELRKE